MRKPKRIMDISAKLGLELRVLRREKLIKQNFLAADVGVSEAYLCQMERGDKLISVQRFVDWCDALEVSANEILAKVIERERGNNEPDGRGKKAP